jgi:hypothetical protein
MLEVREVWVDTEGNRDALRDIFERGFTQKIDSQNPEEQERVRSQIHGRLGQFISQLTARASRGKASNVSEKENPPADAGELWTQRPDRPGPGRLEMRFAGEGFENTIQETAVTVLAGCPGENAGHLERLSQKIQGALGQLPVERFAERLRRAAVKRLQNIEKRAGFAGKNLAAGVRVDSDLAQFAVNYFVGKYLKAEIKGSYAMAFDLEADANFREALMQTRSRIGLILLSKRMARDLNKNYLKNIRYQLVSHLRRLLVPSTVNNRKAVPMIGEGNPERLDPSLFEVRVDQSKIGGEPYLEVVERVVQILSGLLTASQIVQASELQDPRKAQEIKETLLKQLFDVESGTSDLIVIRNGTVVLNRELLRNFIVEHLAAQSFSQAA